MRIFIYRRLFLLYRQGEVSTALVVSALSRHDAIPSPRLRTELNMEYNLQALIRQQCLIDGQWRASLRCWLSIPEAETPSPAFQSRRGGDAQRHRRRLSRHRAGSGLLARSVAILRRWGTSSQLAHAEDIARIMTAEQGKPLAESRGEVLRGVLFVEFFAEEASGSTARRSRPTERARIIVHKQPWGMLWARSRPGISRSS